MKKFLDEIKSRFRQWWPKVEPAAVAAGIVLLLSVSGCADMFAAKTSARYVIHPDGTREIFYESGKEQVGLDASVDKNGLIHVKVDKAGTQESVIAAALQSQIMMGEILKSLLPLVTKAAGVP